MKKLIFLSILILFSCSKYKKTFKNVDVDLTPIGLVEVSCAKQYAVVFFYDSKLYVVETIADKYKNSWNSLPVTIDFKVINKINCDTDGQLNAELYEVEIKSIKDR